jgi:hypothetical protein
MENEILNYEEDTKIDPKALDVEWLEQANLMLRYTKHAAAMEKVRDEAKEALGVKRAQIEMDIRNNPDAYKLAKPTEAGIASTILLQKEYQELAAELTQAQYELGIAIGAVRAIDQRKTALENLVKLLGQSYFAGPKAPRDLNQEHLDHLEARRANTKVRMQRTRKGQD